MNKNKGVINLGLVISIVLLVAIVGGTAYYFGKGNSKPVVITPENILPNVENQNLPVVDNSQQVNVANTTTPTVATGCTSSSVPSITVLSPNGGETYTAGQKITVKWKSCNVSASSYDIIVALHQNGDWQNIIYLTNGSTINDGSEIFTIPSNITVGSYKIRVGSVVTKVGQDFSDNSFTINSSKVTPTTDMKLLSFKANKGEFLAETPRLINSSNVEIKVYFFPTGTGMTEPSLLGSMAPLTGSSGSIQTWSLSAYIQPYTSNKTALMATSISATLYIDGKVINTIEYPVTGASAIYDSIYGNIQ